MIELTGVTIPKEVRNLVSVNLLKKYQCIPFELDPYNANILHSAMSDPYGYGGNRRYFRSSRTAGGTIDCNTT